MCIAHCIENTICDCPVVNRRAVGALGVHICRAPLQRPLAIARSEHVMCAEVHRSMRRVAQLSQFIQQFPPMRTINIVRLVRAKEAPDRGEHARRSISVYGHTNSSAILTVRRERCENQYESERKGLPAHGVTLN